MIGAEAVFGSSVSQIDEHALGAAELRVRRICRCFIDGEPAPGDRLFERSIEPCFLLLDWHG